MNVRRIMLATIGLVILSLVAAGCFGPRTGEVSGKITYEGGLPVIGAVVKIADKTATTRNDGTFRITGIRQGAYQLTVTVDGEVVATQQVTISRNPAVVNIVLDMLTPKVPELVVVRSAITEAATDRYPTYGQQIEALIQFLEPDYNFAILSDQDVVDGKLAGAKLVILNDQGVMSQDEVQAFQEFVNGGGTILATYSTSLRVNNETYDLAGDFQLADILGVHWVQWTGSPALAQIKIANEHPMVEPFEGTIPIAVAARHMVTVDEGKATVVGIGLDADGNVVPDAPLITVSEHGVYVAFSLLHEVFLTTEDGAKLVRSIIDHYAPGARK